MAEYSQYEKEEELYSHNIIIVTATSIGCDAAKFVMIQLCYYLAKNIIFFGNELI